jgi:hypothetical protein
MFPSPVSGGTTRLTSDLISSTNSCASTPNGMRFGVSEVRSFGGNLEVEREKDI